MVRESVLRNFRVSPEENEQLNRDAHLHGMTASAYIRWLIEKERKKQKPVRQNYYYGMRLRGFSPGCQPMDGFLYRMDDPLDRYHDVIVYNRMLSQKECEEYELDYMEDK